MKKKILTFSVIALLSSPVYSQVGINNNDPKVTLDVTAKNTNGSSSEGIRAPRLTGDVLHDADTNGVYSTDQNGAWVFVTAAAAVANQVGQTADVKERGYYYFDAVANKWVRFSTSVAAGTVIALNCAGAVNTGALTSGTPASGVSSQVPYTGGNGGAYTAQSVTSSGVTGLTANLAAGTLANGAGNLVYTITGTPSGAGTASFVVSMGSQSCTLTRTVALGPGTITGLNCAAAVNNGVVVVGVATAGVTSQVPYTGGNGGSYAAQAVPSTGITGLTATLAAGTLANGSGNLTLTITGTPSALGTASFALNIGGQSCTLTMPVRPMGAFTAPGVYTAFMPHNLGANTALNAMTPAAGIHGAKYQWGAQTGQVGRYIDQATDQTNNGLISGWITATALPDNTWQDAVKTAADPCPAGFRVPTSANWQGVVANNAVSRVGTWTNSQTNFSSALYFGQNTSNKTMMLPAAGLHVPSSPTSVSTNRGDLGRYWSSSQSTNVSPLLNFDSSAVNVGGGFTRTYGYSVRCISQ